MPQDDGQGRPQQSQEFVNAVVSVLANCYDFNYLPLQGFCEHLLSEGKPLLEVLYQHRGLFPENVTPEFVYEQIFAQYCEICGVEYQPDLSRFEPLCSA